MDTTVASSVKGEPELNIGKKNTMLLAMLSLPNLSPQALWSQSFELNLLIGADKDRNQSIIANNGNNLLK